MVYALQILFALIVGLAMDRGGPLSQSYVVECLPNGTQNIVGVHLLHRPASNGCVPHCLRKRTTRRSPVVVSRIVFGRCVVFRTEAHSSLVVYGRDVPAVIDQ